MPVLAVQLVTLVVMLVEDQLVQLAFVRWDQQCLVLLDFVFLLP